MDEQKLKRLSTANDALREAYESLDPESEDYKEKLEAIAKLHKEIANDELKDLACDRLEEEKRANRKRETLDVIGKIIIVGTTLFTGVSQLAMFWRSSKREDGDEKHDGKPYLTQTDKTVVQEGLRGGFWKNLPKI